MRIVRWGPKATFKEAEDAGKTECPILLEDFTAETPIWRIDKQFYDTRALARVVGEGGNDPLTRKPIVGKERSDLLAEAGFPVDVPTRVQRKNNGELCDITFKVITGTCAVLGVIAFIYFVIFY